jgi:hypothetical protein
MGANPNGTLAWLAAAGAGDQSGTFPHTLPQLNQGPGNQGTAAMPVFTQGQPGTRGSYRGIPRSLSKGNAGSIAMADPVFTPS